MKLQIFSAMLVGLVLVANPAAAQYYGLPPAERALWLSLGFRRINNANFVRGMYALETLDQSRIRMQQQQLQQQLRARQQAFQERERLRSALTTGETEYVSPAVVNPEMRTPEGVSDVMLCWEVFGCTFREADEAMIRKIDDKFDGGLRVAAIKIGSPVDRAGWKDTDILVGLYKYRIRSYDDVAYVASMSNLLELSPMRTILLRDGKAVEGTIDFRSPKLAAEEAEAGAAAKPEESPAKSEESPNATEKSEDAGKPMSMKRSVTGEPLRAVEAKETREDGLAWEMLGIKGHSVDLSVPSLSFSKGVQIDQIRPGSVAAKTDLRTNAVLVGLGPYETQTLADVDFALKEAEKSEKANFIVVTANGIDQGTFEFPQEKSANPSE